MNKHFTAVTALVVGAAILGFIAINPFSGQHPQAEASSTHVTTTIGNTAPASLLAPAGEQLLEAIKSTRRFRDIDEALDRGYENINVFAPGQGCHYLNASLLDGTFDHKRPEILVYAESPGDDPVLVAIEYAVPISASPDHAPEGFAGGYDVWHRNETFQLWTLHAWTSLPNPDGVFAANNPLAPQESAGCGLHQGDD